jgi:hypothetical protein
LPLWTYLNNGTFIWDHERRSALINIKPGLAARSRTAPVTTVKSDEDGEYGGRCRVALTYIERPITNRELFIPGEGVSRSTRNGQENGDNNKYRGMSPCRNTMKALNTENANV